MESDRAALAWPDESELDVQPVRTWESMLACFPGTTTTTGLDSQAVHLAGFYPTGQRVSDAAMDSLHLTPQI